MLRFVKWLLGLVVTLVVLIIAAIIIVPMVFDPNDYRDDITALVKEHTGRELKLDGELKVSVFPWLGIRTEGLALSQPAEIGGDMVSVDTAQLRVKFAPLLSKQVHIDTVVLKQPKLRLVTLKNGIDSFSGLSGDDAAEDDAEQDSAGAAVALVIQGVELTDGSLVIDDRVEGSITEVSKLNVVSGNLIGDSMANLRASGSMKTSDSPDALDFSLSGLAQIDIDTLLVSMAELQATVLQADNDITMGVDALSFANSSKLDITGLQVTLRGPADVVLTMPSLAADVDSQRANIPSVDIDMGAFKGRLSELKAQNFIDAPSASGRLSVPAFNAANLLKDLDIDYQTADPAVLRNVAFEADFSGSLDAAEVKNLALTLDDSQLTGSASVKNFDKPAAKFNLDLNQLNLDRYLPPTEEEQAQDSAGVAEALVVPMAAFKEIQANGQFKAQQLISGGVEMNNIDVQVRSTPGNVTITPTASLYDGSLAGQIAFSEQGETSRLAVKNEVDLVQLGRLLNAAEVTDQLSGIGSLLVDLVVTEVNGVQTNQGVIKLQAKNGAIQGMDIKSMIDGAYAKYQSLKGREPNENEEGTSSSNDETKFAELLGTFNVNNNVITNDDFSMKAPLFRVAGAGTIDLSQEIMDYTVEVKLVASTDGQGGESIDALSGIPIPIRLRGKLTEPSYSIDFKRMYKALFAREVDKKKGEFLQEKLGIEGGEKLSTKDVLKSVLGGAIDKKLNKDKANTEQPVSEPDSQQERPLTERDAAPAENQEAPQEPEPEKSAEDQLKDDLKNRLLDGLFGK